MIDRQTNRRRGFGFVSFKDAADAMKVLAMGNEGTLEPPGGFRSGKILLFGKVCEVKVSEPKKGWGRGRSRGGGGETSDQGDVLKGSVEPSNSDASRSGSKDSTNGDMPGYVQFQTNLGGLDPATASQDPAFPMSQVPYGPSGGIADSAGYYPQYHAQGGMPTPGYYSKGTMHYYNPAIQTPGQGIYYPPNSVYPPYGDGASASSGGPPPPMHDYYYAQQYALYHQQQQHPQQYPNQHQHPNPNHSASQSDAKETNTIETNASKQKVET